jgi:chromosome segregation ATPase
VSHPLYLETVYLRKEQTQSLLASQVAVLEDRLAKSGSTESHFLEELNSLRSALDAATIAKKQAEQTAKQASETTDRLSEANETISAKVLTLAEEAEEEKRVLQRKLQEEVDSLKKKLIDCEEEVEEQRARGQGQRIQLLDEVSIL